MSGDVQPRKRKDKRRKKGQLEARRSEEYLEESTVFKQGYTAAQIQDIPLHFHHADSTATKRILKPDDEEIHTTSGSDEIIHVQKDSRLGGNICAKIVFFCLLGALGVMIGLILTEYRGSSDVKIQSPVDSPWSQMLEGWVDDSVDHHDEADSHGVDHDHEELGEEDIHSEEEKSGEEDEDHESEHDHEDESEEEDEVGEEDSDEDKDEDYVSEENVSNEVGQDDDDVDNESAEDEDEDEDDQDHEEEEEDDDDDENESLSDEEDQVDSKENEYDSQENEEDNDSIDESVRAEEEDNESIEEQDEKDQTDEEGEEEEDTNESKEEEEEEESYEETINEGTDEESEEKEGEHDDDSIEAATAKNKRGPQQISLARLRWMSHKLCRIPGKNKTAEKMKEYEAQMKEQEEEEEEEEDEEEEEEETPKIIEEDETEDEEEQAVVEEVESQGKPDVLPGEEGEGQVEEEEETTGVALKFGVGVALVVVAHVVLVRKWNRCGEEGIEQAKDENVSGESVTEVPDLTRRQTLIPPSVEPPVTSPPAEQHVTEEYEYSEQEDEDEEEEEDEKHVMETLEDLKAKYQQMTPEDSDVEPEEEEFASKPTYTPTPPHSEPEEEQSEVEEEEEEEEEDDPLAQWKSVRGREMLAEEVEEVQTGSEEEEEEEPPPVPIRRGGPRSSDEQIIDENIIEEHVIEEQEYVNADITNSEDWEFREELDLADAELNNGKPEIALKMFSEILTHHPRSPRAYHGKAQALDQLAEAKRSNQLLVSAINTYLEAVELPNIPDKLFLRLANRTIDRMRFKGMHMKAVAVHHKLIHRFHNDPWHRNQLAVNYMMINRLADAELVLEQTRQRWPSDGLTQAYYGLVLKLRGKHVESIPLLRAGINSQAEGTTDSHFYFHLGDALSRQNKTEEAMQVYAKGVDKGLFRSVYQRSLYNVDRLKAQPWWTIEETTYAPFFKKLEENWKVIRDEGLSALKAQIGFEDEAESLRDTGNWKQFELFARGQKYQKNCEQTPITCRLIEDFPPASGCRRGQTKFSVMEGGTHVWPHCGPTNCRLRAHLGLVIPNGTAIRVAEDTRNWAEGKVFIFDDSFEHEVWHKGTEKRLVLIVDVWHPELTPNERATLTTI